MSTDHKPHNCWEYWHCSDESKERCPAYKVEAGKECYIVTSFVDKPDESPKKMHDFAHCGECPWYSMIKLGEY